MSCVKVQHYLLEVYEYVQVRGSVRFAVLHKAKVLLSGIVLEIPPNRRIVLGRSLCVCIFYIYR